MKRKKIDDNKKVAIFVVLVTLLVFGMVYYYTFGNKTFSSYKADKTKKLVYPIYQKGKTSVPNINIDSTEVKTINKVIIDNANEFLQKEKNNITYDYEINGKIISLAIQYIDFYDESGYPKITYDVYNINFHTGKLLTKEDILSLYGVTEDQVAPLVEAKFQEYYVDLHNKKYIQTDECDYLCFLYLSGIIDEKYMENINYYIKNGNLYVIRPFNIYTYYDTQKYFTTKSFLIQITE